jgi:hypothetical protein
VSKPKLISNWVELKAYAETDPSPTHRLDIDKYSGCIHSKDGSKNIRISENCMSSFLCLTTHTFYARTHAFKTYMLQQCGFNIVLRNWDANEPRNKWGGTGEDAEGYPFEIYTVKCA